MGNPLVQDHKHTWCWVLSLTQSVDFFKSLKEACEYPFLASEALQGSSTASKTTVLSSPQSMLTLLQCTQKQVTPVF